MAIEKLKQARDHLRDWLKDSRSVAAAAPEAKKLEEQLDWEVRTLEERPEEAANLSTTGIDDRAEDLFKRVNAGFTRLPPLDLRAVTAVNSLTTSTGSATVVYVTNIGKIGTSTATEYAERALAEYRTIQDRQNRPDEINSLLGTKQCASLQDRFAAARSAYEKSRAGHLRVDAVAIAARTFVDGLKGEVLEKARHRQNESISLDEAVARLYGASQSGVDVKYEMDRRGDLIADLSDVAKGRKAITALELDGVWSRVLNHAFVVLSGLP